MKNKWTCGLLAGVLVFCWGSIAQAAERGWSVELTPYVWLAGMDADVTVGERSGEIDVGFDDLVDYVDFAGGLLLTAEKNRWIVWAQGDYMDLDSDNDVTDFDALGTLETQLTIVEAAFGYQFDNPLMKKAVMDVLIGGRYTRLENTFDAATGASFERDNDLFDPMLVLRPWFPLTRNLAFNPTLAIGGGGDSDFIYELQPQLRYNFTDRFSVSAGYRRLYYDVEEGRSEFDGSLHGALVGLGVKF